MIEIGSILSDKGQHYAPPDDRLQVLHTYVNERVGEGNLTVYIIRNITKNTIFKVQNEEPGFLNEFEVLRVEEIYYEPEPETEWQRRWHRLSRGGPLK